MTAKFRPSGEDYLEAVLIVQRKNGMIGLAGDVMDVTATKVKFTV